MMLIAGGIIVPNLALATFAIWYGVPPRSASIAIYALIGLTLSRGRWTSVIPLVIAASLFDVAIAVCKAFFLDPTDISEICEMLTSVDLFNSGFYQILIGLLALQIAITAAFLLRYGPRMAQGSRAVFGATCLIVLGGDIYLNGSVAYELGPMASIGHSFQSGAMRSGFAEIANPNAQKEQAPSILLIVVESLGVLRDPAARATLLSPFEEPSVREHYDVTIGTSSFFGATSYGEMRELCGTRSSYQSLWNADRPPCLPEQMAKLGYRTMSVHGYKGAFYDRESWYPKAGFRQFLFRPELAPDGHYRCKGPFAGPCDADVASRVGDLLAPSDSPAFVYWMTLSSHIPVQIGIASPRFGCDGENIFKSTKVCQLAEIWSDLFDEVAGIAARHPGTEILLVGDHAPPLWLRSARARFRPDQVQWIRLKPKASPIPSADGMGLRASAL